MRIIPLPIARGSLQLTRARRDCLLPGLTCQDHPLRFNLVLGSWPWLAIGPMLQVLRCIRERDLDLDRVLRKTMETVPDVVTSSQFIAFAQNLPLPAKAALPAGPAHASLMQYCNN